MECVAGSVSIGLLLISVQKFLELPSIAWTEQLEEKPKSICEETEFHIKEKIKLFKLLYLLFSGACQILNLIFSFSFSFILFFFF